jgi:5-bromo-4-chloroindolyl phosphate hydrolysis protein
MSILFSFIVFILCSNLYIIVDFSAKSIFFYDIYVKDSREKKKKNLILAGLLPVPINYIILTFPSFVLIFGFFFLIYKKSPLSKL